MNRAVTPKSRRRSRKKKEGEAEENRNTETERKEQDDDASWCISRRELQLLSGVSASVTETNKVGQRAELCGRIGSLLQMAAGGRGSSGLWINWSGARHDWRNRLQCKVKLMMNRFTVVRMVRSKLDLQRTEVIVECGLLCPCDCYVNWPHLFPKVRYNPWYGVASKQLCTLDRER
jgi:hypothetical protein